ncbi:MAG TPA: hypothetical protein P5083_00820 [Candidatus Paceibacterota bacterium]|nr:hypothetical protein [Candidatus Pacearchaeota archaeon]HRR94671.1 hypothetical protein [Candidatus Paceibacterota bacterium]HRU20827.1 hypothetical protein [Candidatus Paceibacterota bacterium]
MDKIKIIYKKKKVYKPSKLKPNHKHYFDKVRDEVFTRQVVKVDNHNVIFGVEGPIILSEGKFWSISAEVENGRWGKHWIMVAPDLPTVLKRKSCFLRIDSGCLSGVLGDRTCDCIEQLKVSQIEALKKQGVIIYIPKQDGRGYGSEFKMANQRIMNDCKMDTIIVAEHFYENYDKIDIRTFDEAVIILKAIGFPKGYKFNLGTKNPRKVQALLEGGYIIKAHEISIKNKGPFLENNFKAKYKFFEKEKEKYETY